MSNYTAADMSTAAANGHRDGYQAGYADAVKAFEAAQPPAAQEAVALYYVANVERGGDFNYIPISMFDQPAIFATEAKAQAFCDFANGAGSKHEVRTFAAPVAAAPADRAALLYLMQQFDAESWQCPQCGHAEDTATMDSAHYLRRYLAENPVASTPAAPGIDHALQIVLKKLRRFAECAEDGDNDGCDIGRGWFDALTTIGLLERTQRSPALWTMTKAGEALIDASPKGSDAKDTSAQLFSAAKDFYNGTVADPTVRISCSTKDHREHVTAIGERLRVALNATQVVDDSRPQATSAEVGS